MTNKQPSSDLKFTREQQVSLPSPDSERLMAIRCTDWERLKRGISQVSHPISWLSTASSICFGIAGTAGFSIIPLTSLQGLSPWVIPGYVCSFVATLILGVVFLVLHRHSYAERASHLSNIETDMESMESGLQTKGAASERQGS